MASPAKKSSQMSKQESLILSSNNENPQIISIQSATKKLPPQPMSAAGIKDLIYG
jgi:hypothetical protein